MAEKKKAIGLLTGGGDAPGLNAAIVAFVRFLSSKKPELKIKGIRSGWGGLVSDAPSPNCIDLPAYKLDELIFTAGTILLTSRINPLEKENMIENVKNYLKEFEGLVAIGGDNTLSVALKLSQEGFPIIGVPKTMDLDLSGTEYSLGFQSYVEATTELLQGFVVTCKSHRRVGVCEVFGRHTGFTAVEIGLATDADFIIIPEMELDLDLLVQQIVTAFRRKEHALVIVSEGLKIETADQGKIDPFGNELLKEKRIGEFLARQIEQMTKIETRSFQASHPLRGIPFAYDAVMGLRFGQKAAEMVINDEWGKMVALLNNSIVSLPLHAFQPRRIINPSYWQWKFVQFRNQGII